MSITYQQAKRIRKTGLLSLFADQLMYEKKITTAIGKTISLKTRGTMMGLGQYFDPLNIAKLLTFGSSLGPALLGHFTGRDVRDIQYFTGRLKPIHERSKTASRISKMPGGVGGTDIESNMVLRKMYKLMASSYESDLRRQELAKNREEENQLEDDKRHKELLNALGGRPTATVIRETDVDTNSWFDRVKSMINSSISVLKAAVEAMFLKMLNFVKKSFDVLRDTIMPWAKMLVEKLGSGLIRFINTVGSVVRFIGNFLFNPLTLMALAGGAFFYGIEKLKHSEFGLKRNIARLDNIEIPSARAELDKEVRLFGPDSPKVQGKKEKLDRLVKEREGYGKELQDLLELKKNNIDDLKGKFDNLFSGFNPTETPNIELPDLALPKFEKLNLDINDANAPTASVVPPEPSQPAVTPPKVEMPAFDMGSGNTWDNSKPTSRLNTVVTENQNRKLPSPMVKPSTTNNTTNVNKTMKPTPVKKPLPSVRNHEESFQRMIFDSTVVIS